MSNVRLVARNAKTAPIGADLLFVGDSANSYNEVKSTITQVLTNNDVTITSGTPATGNLSVWNSSSTVADSGITVDHAQNLTNVGNINGIVLADLLVNSNNLSDLSNIGTARSNLGLGTAATKTASSASATGVSSVVGSVTIGHIAVFSDDAGSIEDGGSTSDFLLSANNLSDVTNAATSRANLGLGTAATKTATGAGTYLASINGASVIGHIAIFNDTVGTIEDGGAITQFLQASNNLNDVESETDAFNNISPLTTKGDLIGYNGSSNVRIPIGTNGYFLQANSAATGGFSWVAGSSVGGFVDNAIFVGSTGQGVASSSPTPVRLDTISQTTIGNTWTTNGDGISMKCGQAGTYSFIGTIPVQSASTTLTNYGYMYCRFAKNGTVTGPMIPYNAPNITGNWTASIPVFAMIACNVNDLITLCVYSGTVANTYLVAAPIVTGALNASSVEIVRLI